MNEDFDIRQETVSPAEKEFEKALRPLKFSDFSGQTGVVENLEVFVEAAKYRGEPLDHTLLHGPPGLGKTTLSNIIANELGVGFKITSGPVLDKPGDLAGILTSLEPNDVLFIDEIHRLSPVVEEYLYSAMEDYRIDIMIDKGPSARSIQIDLNFGCPVKKVAGKGAGAGMLRNIPLLLDITREVVKAVNVPVTVKTRLGWDCDNLIITELAEQLQDCGIQALTIHGRTRSQMYTGEADWSLIGEVKNNPRIHIPIIGNGDIATPEEAKLAFDRYGVDAVMIGRATFGRPWIFKEIRDYLDNTGAAPLTVDEKIDLLEEQLRINVERIDEYRGILHTRRHLAASPIFKGIPDFRQTRIAMLRATTVEELKEILKECRERIKAIQ